LRAHRRAENKNKEQKKKKKRKKKKKKKIRNNKNFKKSGKQSLVVAFCENSMS
jgi:hypothetical protein